MSNTRYTVKDARDRWIGTVIVGDDGLVTIYGRGNGTFGHFWPGEIAFGKAGIRAFLLSIDEHYAADKFTMQLFGGDKALAQDYIRELWPRFVEVLRADMASEVQWTEAGGCYFAELGNIRLQICQWTVNREQFIVNVDRDKPSQHAYLLGVPNLSEAKSAAIVLAKYAFNGGDVTTDPKASVDYVDTVRAAAEWLTNECGVHVGIEDVLHALSATASECTKIGLAAKAFVAAMSNTPNK